MSNRTFPIIASVIGSVGTAMAQQVPVPNDIATCSLIVDPTAQRLCIESAKQSRPASTFDPTAQKQRLEQRPPPRRDAMSPASRRPPTGNAGIAPKAPSPEKSSETYREGKWRLQIP